MNPFSDIRDIANLTRQEFEQRCTSNTSTIFLGDYMALTKILTKYKMYVDTRDMGIAPHLMMDGYWESWLTQCLARVVKPGNICMDIGANLGYYSLLMSELCGHEGRTVAVEPNPKMCTLLRYTEFLHSWKFDIIDQAIADKEGSAVLTIPDRSFGGATLNSDPGSPFAGISRVDVKVTTVDNIVKNLKLPRVDVIKMDVEGFEPLAFEGMKDTIANNPDLKVIIEYSPFSYPDKKKFSDLLIDKFTIHRIKDVDSMETLTPATMEKLIDLQDHTDLYLVRK